MIRVRRSAIVDAPIDAVWTVLRDFNSHDAWHPIVAESHIEHGEAPDRVGCIRNFRLTDGHHVREQLLTLDDEQHVSTYCILEATLPMKRYVATLQLRRVTDGDRTFWHWESTFDVPPGREAEFDALVGGGVYEGGFAGLSAWLRRGGRQGARPTATRRASATEDAGAMAGRAVRVQRFGDPDVLSYDTISVAPPGEGEVRIRQTAIGVNYIDVYVRSGRYRLIEPPAIPGMEGAGVVVDVGSGVAHLLPGDRVAYASAHPGSYASLRTLPARDVVPLPDDVPDEIAAALMLKGMTAACLLHRTCRVHAGDRILVHAAAGGLGLMLCRWARSIGARVYGTVSNEEKARVAREHGCEHPIVAGDHRFAKALLAMTDGDGVQIVFDGIGRAAQQDNLQALARCGHWVSLGQAGGSLDAVPIDALSEKSLSFSRPVVFDYTRRRQDLDALAAQVFDAWRSGVLAVQPHHRFPLAEAARAHRELEARRTTGPVILLP
ncbi:MAG: SRPBCC family protein [Lautropia sp.]